MYMLSLYYLLIVVTSIKIAAAFIFPQKTGTPSVPCKFSFYLDYELILYSQQQLLTSNVFDVLWKTLAADKWNQKDH